MGRLSTQGTNEAIECFFFPLAHAYDMQIERIPLSDDDEVALFSYEPADVLPTTHVFGRWEEGMTCGPCAGMSFIFLANTVDDFDTVFFALRHGANDTPTGEDKDEYAERHVAAFFDRLRYLEARSGGSLAGATGGEVQSLLNELNEHVFLATPGMAIAGAGLEGHGTVLDYLADEWNQELGLAMLEHYCEDSNWQDVLGPDPAVVRSQIEGKKTLVIPGDEALLALAINLYNKGAYEECSVEDE